MALCLSKRTKFLCRSSSNWPDKTGRRYNFYDTQVIREKKKSLEYLDLQVAKILLKTLFRRGKSESKKSHHNFKINCTFWKDENLWIPQVYTWFICPGDIQTRFSTGSVPLSYFRPLVFLRRSFEIQPQSQDAGWLQFFFLKGLVWKNEHERSFCLKKWEGIWCRNIGRTQKKG